MNKRTKTLRTLEDQKLMDGLQKQLGKNGSLVFAETKHTCAQLVTMLRERLDSLQAIEAAHNAWKRALQEDAALLEKTDPVLSGARQALLSLYGKNVEALAVLGLAPRKAPRELTPEERIAKREKLRATREARKTMGSRQQAAVHGSVVATAPPPAPPAGNGAAH